MADVDMEPRNIQHSLQILLHCAKNATNRPSYASIHKIPYRVREWNPGAFTPRVVSIGPLHKGDQNLLPFEGQKAIFLHDLLLHTGLPLEQTLEACLQMVNASMDRIRACYEGGMMNYTDDEAARMMVMDACFILEYLYKSAYGLCGENMVLSESLVYDLLLLENQIPFFVLQDIFECTRSRFTEITSLNQLVFFLVQDVYIFESNLTIKNGYTSIVHILGFVHDYYRTSHPPSPAMKNFRNHSTTDLDRAGVNFEPHHEDPMWPIAMKLESPSIFACFFRPWAKPTLRMPKLVVTSDTELILRNLIAYEQFTPGVCHYITSYVIALDKLIGTEEDVSILVESEVIVNSIGSNNDAANMINHICGGLYVADFFYSKEWAELDTYYNGSRSKSIAWLNIALLRRTYFSSPWHMIALLAGILVFIFTVVQTYFTIKSAQS